MSEPTALRRAWGLQGMTIVHIIVSAALLFVTLGASQAMKSAFLDDPIGSVPPLALFIVPDGVFKLIHRQHPAIRSTEIFHATVWSGWPMLAALAFAAVPRAVLGRMKLPLGRQLNDKVLYAEAAMNRADWQAAAAA